MESLNWVAFYNENFSPVIIANSFKTLLRNQIQNFLGIPTIDQFFNDIQFEASKLGVMFHSEELFYYGFDSADYPYQKIRLHDYRTFKSSFFNRREEMCWLLSKRLRIRKLSLSVKSLSVTCKSWKSENIKVGTIISIQNWPQ